MNEPQVWTAIGVLAAALAGMMTIVSTLFLRVIRAEFGRVDARFDKLEDRFTALDRDVSALIKDRFGLDRGDA